MRAHKHALRLAVGVLAITMTAGLAACGGDDDEKSTSAGGNSVNAQSTAAVTGPETGSTAATSTAQAEQGDPGATIVLGTTDNPVSYDPAGAYDLPSWNVIYSVYDTLLEIPPGTSQPVPSRLASSCDFTDPKTFTCTLNSGITFQDGSPFDSKDVKFTIDRQKKIEDPNGSSSLLANIKSVDATSPTEVTFNLEKPDATTPFVLATGAGAIVPDETYPADKLQPSDKVVGSGPYKVATYKEGQQTVLEAWDGYTGTHKPANARTIITYFGEASALKSAVEQGEVDIAFRGLSPTDIDDLREADGIQVIEGNGTEIRYIVFNSKLLGPDKRPAIAKAVAHLVDRQGLADTVYNGTVEPLYSMVPQGVAGATQNFKDLYGEAPDPEAARADLEGAGLTAPVDLELWWTPSHYGASSADEYTEIKRQLEEDGLFKVTLKSTEWDQYSEAYPTDKYPAFQLGWFPDFPDPDNYLAPFYASGKASFLNSHYSNPEIDKLLAAEKASTDPAEREQIFGQIQQLAAEDPPIVPIWQGKQIAAAKEGIQGIEQTFDPSFVFRYWLISKTG
jgi:peptide/nickel transport system substrate-binding protein